MNALRADIVKFHQLSGGSIEAVGLLFSECEFVKSCHHMLVQRLNLTNPSGETGSSPKRHLRPAWFRQGGCEGCV
jgi:hypothetical protein